MQDISIWYAMPWVLAAIFLIILFNREQSSLISKQKSLKICVIFFMFFYGLRGFVGWDYKEYFYIYKSCADLTSTSNLWNSMVSLETDKGYALYLIICKTLFSNYHVFIFVSTLIDCYAISLLIKKYSPNYALSYLLFFTFASPLEIDLLRNVKAMFFIFLSFQYIINKDFKRYIVLVLIAVTFHFTTIIFIPFYFFINRKIPKTILISILLAGYIYYFLPNKSISEYAVNIMSLASGNIEVKMAQYGQYVGSGWGFSWGFFERLLTAIALVKYYDVMAKNKTNSVLFSNLTIIYLLVYLLFSDFLIFINRFSNLFAISYVFFFPNLLECMGTYKPSRYYKNVKYMLIVYCLIRAAMHVDIMYRYTNILWESPSIEESLKETSHYRNSV